MSGSSQLAIGIDIGGTNIRGAVVNEVGVVFDMVRIQTPSTAKDLEDSLDLVVRKLQTKWNVAAVGLAIAGFLTKDRRMVQFAPHLPWRNEPVAEKMAARLGIPIISEHDANSAAWAEYRFGSAAAAENCVVLCIGTGVGAGFLINGELYRGSFGVAPELGHLQVVKDGRPCACGKNGCFERYCSGTALVDSVLEIIAQENNWDSSLVEEAKSDSRRLSGKKISAAALAGDPLALKAFTDFAHWLGVGLAMIGDIFDPDHIVLAGGVGGSSELYLEEASVQYRKLITGAKYRRLATITGTRLGESGGLIGVADLARRVHPA